MFARRALVFSSLSAWKKMSSGDASLACFPTRSAFSWTGLGSLFSGDGASAETSLSSNTDRPLGWVVSGTDFDRLFWKNFGIGRDEAAGDAWKVGPA